MIDRNMILKTTSMLLAGLLATGLLVFRSRAQSSAPAGTTAHSGRPSAAAGSPYRNQPARMANRARDFYGLVCEVEALSVEAVQSGEMMRHTYRGIDAEQARTV